jgi:hypothetical protein
MKHLKRFDEGIFSKVKSAFKSDYELIVDDIRKILSGKKSIEEYDWGQPPNYITRGKGWRFDIEINGRPIPGTRFEVKIVNFKERFSIAFNKMPLLNVTFHSTELREYRYQRLKRTIDWAIHEYIRFEKEKEEFELDYPLSDIKNWTYDIKDFDDIEDFEIESLNYGDDKPIDVDILNWKSEPGYLITFENPYFSRVKFMTLKLVIEEVNKMLNNSGLNMTDDLSLIWGTSKILIKRK